MPRKVQIEIIADDRERGVAGLLEENVLVKVRRLDVADYLFTVAANMKKISPAESNSDVSANNSSHSPIDYRSVIVAAERKTWPDFAASIIDGRHNNKDKMIELRRANHEAGGQMRLMYIVEGHRPATLPNAKQPLSVPVATIESAMVHLWFRDNIQIWFTADEADTARQLLLIAESLRRLPANMLQGCPSPEAPTLASNLAINIASDVASGPWHTISGLGPETVRVIVESGLTIADILVLDTETLRCRALALKFDSGRALSAKAVNSLLSWARAPVAAHTAALAAVQGISGVTAAAIMRWAADKISSVGLPTDGLPTDGSPSGVHPDQDIFVYVLSRTVDELATAIVGTRALGRAKAARIFDICGQIVYE
jgi:ERCC4-type nuclease